eukprot:UN32013
MNETNDTESDPNAVFGDTQPDFPMDETPKNEEFNSFQKSVSNSTECEHDENNLDDKQPDFPMTEQKNDYTFDTNALSTAARSPKAKRMLTFSQDAKFCTPIKDEKKPVLKRQKTIEITVNLDEEEEKLSESPRVAKPVVESNVSMNEIKPVETNAIVIQSDIIHQNVKPVVESNVNTNKK